LSWPRVSPNWAVCLPKLGSTVSPNWAVCLPKLGGLSPQTGQCDQSSPQTGRSVLRVAIPALAKVLPGVAVTGRITEARAARLHQRTLLSVSPNWAALPAVSLPKLGRVGLKAPAGPPPSKHYDRCSHSTTSWLTSSLKSCPEPISLRLTSW